MEGKGGDHPLPFARTNKLRVLAVNGLMFAVAVGVFLLIRAHGETLSAPAAGPAEGPGPGRMGQATDTLFHFLLALAVIVLGCRAMSKVFAYLGQPPVIGEVVAGILLGPSLLGKVAPAVSAYVLPESVAPLLGIIAQLGVILYMFLVGLELNAGRIKRHAPTLLAISNASIIVPFLMGSALAVFLYPTLAHSGSSFTSFALFLGVAMSVTAFPVLARILTDRQMQRTQLGVVALSSAATGDVTAWCLLAFVVGVAQARVEDALMVMVWTVV